MRETITFARLSWRTRGGVPADLLQTTVNRNTPLPTGRKRSGAALQPEGTRSVPLSEPGEPRSARAWDKTLTRSKQADTGGSRGVRQDRPKAAARSAVP